MITREEFHEDINKMLEQLNKKKMETEGRWITACRGQYEKGYGYSCIIILSGRRKVKSRPYKGNPIDLRFSHYIEGKHYLGIMMIKEFEKMFLTIIKPNRYMYIKIKFTQGKNRRPGKKKKRK